MENTLEMKAKFFALYIGQKVMLDNIEKSNYPMKIVGFMDEKNVQVEYEAGLTSYYKTNETVSLLLKPLESITDEDAIEVAKILFHHTDPDYNIDWEELEPSLGDIERSENGVNIEVTVRCFEGIIKIGWDLLFELLNDEGKHTDLTDLQKTWVIDYLRSNGYCLPWMGLSVEQLQEYGWIQLKQQ